MNSLKWMLQDNRQAILHSLHEDLNKPETEGYASEIAQVVADVNYALKNLKVWSRPEKVPSSLFNIFSQSMHYPLPFGSVLIIGPWNYPFGLLLQPLVAALAAGDCAVLKPSEYSPSSAKLISTLICQVL